jgi:hypothetical protein
LPPRAAPSLTFALGPAGGRAVRCFSIWCMLLGGWSLPCSFWPSPLGLGCLPATLARGLLPGHRLAPCDLRSLGLGGLPVTRPSHLHPGACYRRRSWRREDTLAPFCSCSFLPGLSPACSPGFWVFDLSCCGGVGLRFGFPCLVLCLLDCFPHALRGFWVFDLRCCG